MGGAAPVFAAASSAPIVKPKTLRQTLPAVAVAAFAAFGGVLYGYDTGTISGLLQNERFREDFGQFYQSDGVTGGIPSNPDTSGWSLSTSSTSLTTSILSVGTFFGALIGAPVADRLGRRWGLQIALLVFTVGVVMQLIAQALPLFDAGRVVAGLGVGILSTIIPMYQSEVAPRWIRGAVVSGYQWAITIGLLCASIANNGTKDYGNTGAYRIPIAIQIAFAIVLSVGLFFLPESPRWQIKRGRHELAAKALAKLNSTAIDDPVVVSELADVQTALDMELTLGNGSYLDCFRANERKNRARTLTGMALQGCQQLTGINFIFYYGTTFAASAGITNPFTFSIISNVVNVVATVPGMWAMERVGRRKLLIWGALGMCSMELIVAILGTIYNGSNPDAQRSLVAFVCIYVAMFASTWGPAAWVVCGEIFPLAIRAKALSLCTSSNWLFNWAIGYATPYMVDSGKGNANLQSKVFFVWAATCFGSAVFAHFFIVETRGLSLEEVDELYATTTPARSTRMNAEMQARRGELEGGKYVAGDEQVEADAAKAHALKLDDKDAQ
ncbi:putative monosaccharide transporter [Tilletiopsis washingtonensis]|uniref:Putative monosaccharide transporter n=1 Tax=Tilletiopsis washingtonensis TaxID=58919 RepID=A0A316ZE30_9BASI|nr:putative monosaccharide transporter [Tilletiopsis washingtonensis]PWN98545.1 putative monosaccharide transporter [Tilletiopsis washingtonensis]